MASAKVSGGGGGGGETVTVCAAVPFEYTSKTTANVVTAAKNMSRTSGKRVDIVRV